VPDRLMFVQFPHPGAEHRPKGAVMPWNRHNHARKFLKTGGQYCADGQVQSSSFTFWGEWEPQSRVVAHFADSEPGWPRLLHEPYWQQPADGGWRQNTDPLVFGDHFLYSNCRQGQNRKLRELAAGSIVLFGSKLAGEFVVDTVFVVGDGGNESSSGSSGDLHYADWVRHVVFEPLNLAAKQPVEGYRLYRGRTREEAPDGPFSFVPCQPCRPGAVGFARPAIRLERRWIEPNLAMAAKATPATRQELGELWDRIVHQVVDQAGLALGVRLDVPVRVGGDTSIQSTSKIGC
jgi:hypothetical protein